MFPYNSPYHSCSFPDCCVGISDIANANHYLHICELTLYEKAMLLSTGCQLIRRDIPNYFIRNMLAD